MISRGRRWPARGVAVGVVGAVLSCLLTSCGSSTITADTSCKDYIGHDQSSRHDAAVRISSEIGSTDPGNPMWGLSLDAACGSAPTMTLREYFQDQQPAQPEPTPTEEETEPSDTPSAEPTYEPVAVDSAKSIGSVVLTSDNQALACASAPFGDSDGQGAEHQILPGGRVLITCSGGRLVMDVYSGAILWSLPDNSDEDVTESVIVGDEHLFVVDATNNPASGLAAAYVTVQVSALDLQTGEQAWTKPLEESVAKADRGNASAVDIVEGPSGDKAHPHLVVIRRILYSAFDAETGDALWESPVADSSSDRYMGYGISLDTSGSTTDGWRAYSTKSGKTVWQKKVPENDGNTELRGSTVWTIGDEAILGIDIRTGRTVLNRRYPTTWTDHLVTPEITVAFDGEKIQRFDTSDVRKPLWTTPSDDISFLAASPDLVLVQAQAGTVVLDGHTGEIRDDVSVPDSNGDWTVVDGLADLGDALFEMSPPTGRAG